MVRWPSAAMDSAQEAVWTRATRQVHQRYLTLEPWEDAGRAADGTRAAFQDGNRRLFALVAALLVALLAFTAADVAARPGATVRTTRTTDTARPVTRSQTLAAVTALRTGTGALLRALESGDEAAAALAQERLLASADAIGGVLLDAERPVSTRRSPTATAHVHGAIGYIRAGANRHDRAALERALWLLDAAAAAAQPGPPVLRGTGAGA
jgi:hypothetical protein